MSSDSPRRTLRVALGVCLVCSVLVSGAVVGLRNKQKSNQELDRLKYILIAADLYTTDAEVISTYRRAFQPVWVDLQQGRLLKPEEAARLGLKDFDPKNLARDANLSRALTTGEDLAKILRRPNYMFIYQVIENGQVSKIVLPVYGKGLWSTMYGLIALDRDLTTIKGFVFYEHGETPGLGGEVDNPRWRQSWVGKKAFDAEGNLRLSVIKGKVDPTAAEANYQIDGLSGATLTTRGVDQLVKFWLGRQGYGSLLDNLRGGMQSNG